jgi:hypothetical protein
MAYEAKCKTPGATYRTAIDPFFIGVEVVLPRPLYLTAEEAEQLELNLHNAVELALAPVYPEGVKVG